MTGEGAVVGRAPECDLVISSAQVSRQHIRLEKRGNDVVFRDLDSRNGVLLNQARVYGAMLVDGDLIQLGDAVLRFHRGAL
jgi:pSer/pThr/pTyr-binding forkhead associated (FHA) protein